VKSTIQKRAEYIHAELTGRENARDMRAFLMEVKAACLQYACPRILISIRASNTMFKAEDYGLMGATGGQADGYLAGIVTPSCRIALVGDNSELHHAHEYIELVARQRQVNVRAFRDTASAARWLESADPVGPAVGPADLDGLKPGGSPKLA
jgi:hypothetical protein